MDPKIRDIYMVFLSHRDYQVIHTAPHYRDRLTKIWIGGLKES